MNTKKYLHKNLQYILKKESNKNKKNVDDNMAKPKLEIVHSPEAKIIKNKACEISKTITNEITHLFSLLPNNIKQNLPDDFYHIRHNTLICSKNKELADERIQLLKSIYGSVEEFNNFDTCLGRRNGDSGCRDCCNSYFSGNYKNCVNSCMDF